MVDALLFLLLFLGVPAGVTALCFMTLGPSPQAIAMSIVLAVLALGLLADYRRDASYYHPAYADRYDRYDRYDRRGW
jgi:hypothetical protein